MSQLVIFVDGIVSAFARRLTPDVTWTAYHAWLTQRRPDLELCHLQQPWDWVDIFSGRAEPYAELQADMESELQAKLEQHGIPDSVVFLGFSLGGLTALSLASRWEEMADGFPGRFAFITFGTPFAGVSLLDRLFAKANISYIERIYNLEQTKQQAKRLAGFARHCPLTVLAHSIDNDEMVRGRSARMIADWLYFTPVSDQLQFGSFSFDPHTLIQPHNSLMHNNIALSYIDGLLDGLLSPPGDAAEYLPPDHNQIRHLREAQRSQS